MNQNKLFLVIFCLILPLIQASSVQYCDRKADYQVKVKSVDFPDPVIPGKEAIFKIYAKTDEPIYKGEFKLEVSYFGIRVHKETHKLCDETACPVLKGNFVLSHSQVLPIFTPPGSYTLLMKMYDGNKNELSCFKFNFRIGYRSSVADS